MKHFLSFLLMAALGMGAVGSVSPLLGKWKTKDDETGRIKSVVEITERDGKFYGTVVELFRLPEETKTPTATSARTTARTSVLGWRSSVTWCQTESWNGKTARFVIPRRAAFTTAKCGLTRTTWTS